jgi:hypothetical protein
MYDHENDNLFDACGLTDGDILQAKKEIKKVITNIDFRHRSEKIEAIEKILTGKWESKPTAIALVLNMIFEIDSHRSEVGVVGGEAALDFLKAIAESMRPRYEASMPFVKDKTGNC